MINNHSFLKQVVNSLPENIVVIDTSGTIRLTNAGWDHFGQQNNGRAETGNYLAVCDASAEAGDDFGRQAAWGIRGVINGKPSFHLEYPCHSPDKQRWFMMTAVAFDWESERYLVITHKDITQRRLAEDSVRRLSQMDALTGVANRRYLEDFVEEEWRRCRRLGLPLSLAILDIDHFKAFNDTFGHMVGDERLIACAETLDQFARRPGDLCARYGGEEFALVLGDTTLTDASRLVESALEHISLTSGANENHPLTASAGLATCMPSAGGSLKHLFESADHCLYEAKSSGRNQFRSMNLD